MYLAGNRVSLVLHATRLERVSFPLKDFLTPIAFACPSLVSSAIGLWSLVTL
jgi:hypothetical protein